MRDGITMYPIRSSQTDVSSRLLPRYSTTQAFPLYTRGKLILTAEAKEARKLPNKIEHCNWAIENYGRERRKESAHGCSIMVASLPVQGKCDGVEDPLLELVTPVKAGLACPIPSVYRVTWRKQPVAEVSGPT